LAGYEAEHGQVTEEGIRDAARRARGSVVVVHGNPQEQGPGQGGATGGGVMLVLDAGAFVAVKHGDSDVVTLVSGCGWRGGCR